MLKNGTTTVANMITSPGDTGDVGLTCSVMIELVATDYLEIVTFQNSTGSLNVYGNNEWGNDTVFGVNFLGA